MYIYIYIHIYIHIYPTQASSVEDWRTDITRNPLLLLHFWCRDHCLVAPDFDTYTSTQLTTK